MWKPVCVRIREEDRIQGKAFSGKGLFCHYTDSNKKVPWIRFDLTFVFFSLFLQFSVKTGKIVAVTYRALYFSTLV